MTNHYVATVPVKFTDGEGQERSEEAQLEAASGGVSPRRPEDQDEEQQQEEASEAQRH